MINGIRMLLARRPGTNDRLILKKLEQFQLTSIESERIDLKRAELLNVLWAETVARTENDWYRIANQKLNHYEKVRLIYPL